MECPKCQHENPPQSKFCFECGAGLELACPKCGISLPTGVKFCNGCGHDLSQLGTPPEAPTKTPETYVPTGERRQATVLFSDLSGYTAMNEKLDPEEVEGIMSRIKAEAVKIVESHGGIVSQFVGDEVLALFGIPAAHEDDPRRAVKAALELHELAHTMSPEVEEKIGRPLRMHTGINSGLIVTSLRDVRDGTVGVTGDTVNTGARLKALAEDDQILVSPDTQRRIAPFFETEALSAAELKGKDAALTPYRVVGETAVETRFEASERRGLSRYVGRERELEMLWESFHQAEQGQGQVVTVVGEAGLGKTRLIYEFRTALDLSRVNQVRGRCAATGESMSYLPFVDLFQRWFRIRNTDSPAQMLDKARSGALALDPVLEEHLPALLHLLSIPGEHSFPPGMAGEAIQRKIQAALKAYLAAGCKERPLVMVFEDLHWVDDNSEAMFQQYIESISTLPVTLLLSYRPEYRPPWGHYGHLTPLVLKPLAESATEDIVASTLKVESLPEGLAPVVHSHTEGNPFFTEEVVLSLEEQGLLRRDNGSAVLTQAVENISFPDSVQAVVRARIDRLPEAPRDTLRLAAVVGREFTESLVTRLSEAKEDVSAQLGQLKSLEMILEKRFKPELEFIFKNAITHQVVYESLLLARRKTLHKLVGLGIEELYANRLPEFYEMLAHHFEQGEVWDKAVEYLELAGEKAGRLFSLRQARSYFLAAVAILDRGKLSRQDKRRRIDLTLKLVGVSFYAATWEQIKILETSRKYAQDLKDDARMAQLAYRMGQSYYVFGWMGTNALTEFTTSLEIADKLGDDPLRARSFSFLGRIYSHTADYNKGIEVLEKAIPMLDALGEKAAAETANAQLVLGRIFGLTGQFSKCYSHMEESIRRSNSIGNPSTESDALTFLGMIKALQGDWQDATDISLKAAEIASKLGNQQLENFNLLVIGYSSYMLGDVEIGISQMQERIRWEESVDNAGMLIFDAWLAELLALENNTKAAAELCRRISRLKKETGQGTGDVNMHRVLALIAAQNSPDDWGAVEKHMGECLRFGEERTARPELAISHYRYAELLHKKGKFDHAQEQLDQATALFREMGMNWWLEQAEIFGRTPARIIHE